MRILSILFVLVLPVAVSAYGKTGQTWQQQQAVEKSKPSLSNAIKLDVGIGSVTGIVGLSYAYELIANDLQIEAGLGIGMTGMQFSLMPKWIFGDLPQRFVLGLGVSATSGNSEHGQIAWYNVETGYEYRFENHFVLYLSAGLSMSIAHSNPIDDHSYLNIDQMVKTRFVYARTGFGWAF